jgi:hypothetical protein
LVAAAHDRNAGPRARRASHAPGGVSKPHSGAGNHSSYRTLLPYCALLRCDHERWGMNRASQEGSSDRELLEGAPGSRTGDQQPQRSCARDRPLSASSARPSSPGAPAWYAAARGRRYRLRPRPEALRRPPVLNVTGHTTTLDDVFLDQMRMVGDPAADQVATRPLRVRARCAAQQTDSGRRTVGRGRQAVGAALGRSPGLPGREHGAARLGRSLARLARGGILPGLRRLVVRAAGHGKPARVLRDEVRHRGAVLHEVPPGESRPAHPRDRADDHGRDVPRRADPGTGGPPARRADDAEGAADARHDPPRDPRHPRHDTERPRIRRSGQPTACRSTRRTSPSRS